jgi:hypothetical protein
MQAVWANNVAPRAALAPPSPEAKRRLACKSIGRESGDAKSRRPADTECLQVNAKGKVVGTRYRLSRESAHVPAREPRGARETRDPREAYAAPEPHKAHATREGLKGRAARMDDRVSTPSSPHRRGSSPARGGPTDSTVAAPRIVGHDMKHGPD